MPNSTTLRVNLLTPYSVQQSRIHLKLDEVFLVSSQIRTSQLSNFDQAANQLSRHSNLLKDSLARYSRPLDRLQSTQTLGTQQVKPSHNMAQEHIPPNSIPSIIGIRTHLPMYQRHPCPVSCRCDCHKIRSFRSPSLFRNVLGALFVKYSGYPLGLPQQCSDISCHSQPKFKIQAVYYFPFWFFSSMINMSFVTSYVQEPSISLNIRGTISPSTDVYSAINLDDDQSLRRLFSKRTARPNDVVLHSGDSALLVSSEP